MSLLVVQPLQRGHEAFVLVGHVVLRTGVVVHGGLGRGGADKVPLGSAGRGDHVAHAAGGAVGGDGDRAAVVLVVAGGGGAGLPQRAVGRVSSAVADKY